MGELQVQQALSLHQQGKLDEAEKLYRESLAEEPANSHVDFMLGSLLSQKGREEEAAQCFGRVVERHPENLRGMLALADSLARLGRADECQALYQRMLSLDAKSTEVNARYGLFLASLKKWKEAEPFLRESVASGEAKAPMRINYGNVLRKLGKLDLAIAEFQEAIAIAPSNASAYNCLGEACQAIDDRKAALLHFVKAAGLQPDNPLYQANMGICLHQTGRMHEAIAALGKSLEIRPKHVETMAGLASVLRDACQIDDSVELFRQAVELDPENANVVSKFLYTLNFHPSLPVKEVKRLHGLIEGCFPSQQNKRRPADKEEGELLNVGFLSGDFCAHSVAYFLLHLFESKQGKTMRFFCYSQTPKLDSVSARFKESADGWRSTLGIEAAEVSVWMEEDGIDILIDLSGHTAGGRLDIVAERGCPLTLNWLGYPNCVGLSTVDGRIVDELTDPAEEPMVEGDDEPYRIDGCFLAYRSPFKIPEPCVAAKEDKGLVTFGSFNNAAKLNDRVLDAWCSILRQLPRSRLLLKSWQYADEAFREAVLAAFEEGGVSQSRVELRSRVDSYEEHMALYRLVDIALDTFPYNGTTTTCEALWMGVPVIALAGESHAARVGLSLLTSAGFSEWVSDSEEAYAASAVRLAQNLNTDGKDRLRIRNQVEGSPLGDVDDFLIRFERILRMAYHKAAHASENGTKL